MAYIDIDRSGVTITVKAAGRSHTPYWRWDASPRQANPGEGTFYLWLVTGGRAWLEVDGREHYEVKRGEFFLMPADFHVYRGRQDQAHPLQVTWSILHVHGLEEGAGRLSGVKGIQLQQRLPDFKTCMLLEDRLMAASSEARNHWAICLLHEVRRQMTQAQGSETEQRVRALASEIQEAPGRYRGLSSMLEGIHMSKDHLIRVFKRVHGVPPVEYLISVRIEQAKVLLLTTALPIKVIAARLGYSDSLVFSRQFSRRTGCSPRAFRLAGSL
ncbi:MAG: AraC family transcriptional regulator [Planctomycetota bacterium]